MKSASPELIDLLNSSVEFRMADAVKIITMSETNRFGSADVPIIVAGETYRHDGPTIKRTSTRMSVGLEVDSLTLKIFPNDGDLIEGLPIVHAAREGAFDGATVELRKAFFSAWALPYTTAVGATLLFSGRVSDINPSRTEVELIVKSDVELLNTKVPRNLFQPPCVKSVYSPPCGVQRGAFTVAGTVAGGVQTVSRMTTNLTSQTAGYFDQGVVIFKTGPNAGLRRTVKSFSGGVFNFALPLRSPPGAGDLFDAYPGCDKRQSTCATKFGNLPRFKGFPYVPKPEVAA